MRAAAPGRLQPARRAEAGAGAAVAAVGEVPAERDGQAGGVAAAEVVGVRVALGAELLEPDLGPGVLVGQGDHGTLGAHRPRALPIRPGHGAEQYENQV